MKKAVYIANILQHIESFHVPYIRMLEENGYIVDIIANAGGKDKPDYCHKMYDVCIHRSPFSIKNVEALKTVKRILNDNQYDLIHVHTPMGGVIGRIAAKKLRENGSKVFYTCHGFHFYKGAPLFNWLTYYPVEKFLAKYTDCIITINSEDYHLAKRFAPESCRVFNMRGVGVDTDRFFPKDEASIAELKRKYGYSTELIVFYAAEFIKRKNHRFLVDSFKNVASKVPNARLLLAGVGPTQQSIRNRVDELGLSKTVVFLDYRKDIPDLLRFTDINISTSKQEGFPINVVEGLCSGCPELVSSIRGNIDAVTDHETGLIYKNGNGSDFTEKMVYLLLNKEIREKMRTNCINKSSDYSVSHLVQNMKEIYRL